MYREETSTVTMMVSGGRGVGWDRIISYIKKVVSILDMGGEGFNKRLEVGIDVGRDAFSWGTIGGDDGTAGVARFVYLRK